MHTIRDCLTVNTRLLIVAFMLAGGTSFVKGPKAVTDAEVVGRLRSLGMTGSGLGRSAEHVSCIAI